MKTQMDSSRKHVTFRPRKSIYREEINFLVPAWKTNPLFESSEGKHNGTRQKNILFPLLQGETSWMFFSLQECLQDKMEFICACLKNITLIRIKRMAAGRYPLELIKEQWYSVPSTTEGGITHEECCTRAAFEKMHHGIKSSESRVFSKNRNALCFQCPPKFNWPLKHFKF